MPESLAQLSNLQELDLSYNQLTSLPKEINQLHSLEQLYLEGNSISKEEQNRIRKMLPQCTIKF